MSSISSPREPFETDGASLAASAVRDVVGACPALSSSNALARFEFEAGRGNEGTKILMVEWSSPSRPSSVTNTTSSPPDTDWEVSWDGKTTVVSSSEKLSETGAAQSHRLYFLLPPLAPIPPIIKIAPKNRPEDEAMQTNPLPAIFSESLGASARTAGKKGVLHTKWAKRRVAVLNREIERESALNGEGIALEMAVNEKEWIEENFGIGAATALKGGAREEELRTPTSPKTPGGGRLAEKLRGLKLGTSAQDLSVRPAVSGKSKIRRLPIQRFPLGDLGDSVTNTFPEAPHNPALNPLSPEHSDVAIGVSAFSLLHPVSSQSSVRPALRAVAQIPPSHIIAQQAESLHSMQMNSLDALAAQPVARPDVRIDTRDDTKRDGEAIEDEELFAVTLSPRSPDMVMSPFSLVTSEAVPWR